MVLASLVSVWGSRAYGTHDDGPERAAGAPQLAAWAEDRRGGCDQWVQGLLASAGEAMVPDLFHALLVVSRRRAVLLAKLPGTSAREAQRLGLGLDEPEDSTGWALTDTRAAASWGIPIIAAGDYPPDLYVPSESALRAARSHLGEASNPASRACTAAVAPVRLACLRRADHSHTTREQWPVANHIVVALDIAQDQARGLEALERWQPKKIVRAR